MNRFKFYKAHLAEDRQNYSFMSLSGCYTSLTPNDQFFLECPFAWASRSEAALFYSLTILLLFLYELIPGHKTDKCWHYSRVCHIQVSLFMLNSFYWCPLTHSFRTLLGAFCVLAIFCVFWIYIPMSQ